jgi:hypothetical protein
VAARRDGRVQSFDWYPRVPEYLTLRGAGRQVRIRLHRLARPDEMLAWVEFYERLGRRWADSAGLRRAAPITRRLEPTASVPDLSGPAGPLDPWGAGRAGDDTTADEVVDTVTRPDETAPDTPPAQPRVAPDESAAWLRADASNVWSPGQPPQRSAGFVTPAQSSGEPFYGSADPSQSEDLTRHPHAHAGWNGESAFAWQPTEPPLASSRDESWSPTPAEPDWPRDDAESAADATADDAPTAAVESLASAFAPWKDDGSWQRPQFPRYGPPSLPDAEDDR